MTDAPDAPTPPDAATAPAAAPKRKARWGRRLLITAGILLVLVFLAPLALSLGPVRSMVADKVGEQLDRKVEIGGASAFWHKGIELEDIVVHSPEGFDGPLATVRKVHADVDVLGALTGSIKAKVRVVEPHITVRRLADGRNNLDGVREAIQGDEESKPSSDGPPPQVDLVIIGGQVESLGASSVVEAALRELDLGLALGADGRLGVELQCVADGAAQGGGSARIAATADMEPDGTTPFSVSIPALDLAKLAPLLRDATGLRELAGTLELRGKGTHHADSTLEGNVNAKAAGVRIVTATGIVLGLERLLANAGFAPKDGATDVDAAVSLGNLRVQDPSVQGHAYHEPSITLAAKMLVHPKGWVRIAEGRFDAGRTAQVTMPDVFRLQLEPELRFDGQLAVRADLGRVGALRAVVPALEPLGGGSLDAKIQGTGDRGLEMGLGATIRGLAMRPSEAFPHGYTEPDLRLSMKMSRSAEEGMTLRIYRVASRLLRLDTRDAKAGVALGIDADERFWLEGGFDATLDLASLSRLLAAQLPLEPGERITGSVALGGTGRGRAETMQLNTDVRMRDVVFPASWSAARTRANLQARLAVRNDRASTIAELSKLQGMGLTGAASVRLRRDEVAGTTLDDVEGQFGLDLAQARSWLGGVLGLDPRARMQGRLTTRLHLAAEGAGKRLDATSQLDALLYAPPQGTPIREPRVVLQVSALLPPEGERQTAEVLKLEAAALTLDASGSSYVGGEDSQLDLSLRISGDAAKLAPTLAAHLGEGYEDLRGTGRLQGSLTARGSPAHNARTLLAEGELLLGSWSTSGLNVTDLKATIARESVKEPLSVGVASGLNKGKLFGQGAVTLGGETLPWRSTVDLADVDTSGVVTSKGIGRLLAFTLPALLPAKANVPVLSGRLTAHVEAQAPTIEDPAMMDTLTGSGRISMAQGQIRDSTLFGGGGGGGGLGKVIQGLKLAVPEAGRVLEGATKALTFSTLDSQFRVAKRVVYVDRAKLSGNTLDIAMRGTVNFDKRVAMDSDVTLLGSAGRKLGKVLDGGKIPLKVGGTLATPQVRPNVDMSKLLTGAVGDPKDLIDKVRKGIPKIKNPFK